MDRNIWYQEEAKVWEQALPLGNGRMGAMVFGGAFSDRIQVNEDTLWTGRPGKETRKHSLEELTEIRRLIKEEKYVEADQALSDSMLNVETEMYVPYGNIHIDLMNGEVNGKVTDYSRKLDLQEGIVSTTYLHNGARVEKEAFVSLADDVLVLHIQCSKARDFHFYQSVLLESSVKNVEGLVETEGRCPTGINGLYTDEESVRFCSLIKVFSETGKCGDIFVGSNSIMVFRAEEVTLLFSLKTSFDGYDKLPVSEGREYRNACRDTLEAASGYGYEKLRERHIKEYHKYYDRVLLQIDGEDYSAFPTDVRIKKAGEGTVDNGLVCLLFDYGRYLAICASQPGTQPMNLQGIWNGNPIPPWYSNYTMNINTQMNYWAVETCNLPECHMPLLQMLKDFSEKGNNFGVSGWSSWHNSDLWRFNYEATDSTIWGYWQMGGAWCVRHIWEHYLHTRDTGFLREYYPVMTGAAAFMEDWMVEDGNGYLTVSPSTSPENRFLWNGVKCAVCEGSAMDLSIIYDLFDKVAKAGEVLGEPAAHYREIRDRIKPVSIGEDGRILEWGHELEESEPGHVHVAPLYGFFPADIWADGSYDDAVRKFLKRRLDHGGGRGGWANAWVANIYARLKDGERVMHNIRRMFAAYVYPNLMDVYPLIQNPPFQIEGNFGIVSAICEALIQSHTGKTELIPALPDEWKSGEVHGLVTRDGKKISFKWKDKKAEIIEMATNIRRDVL